MRGFTPDPTKIVADVGIYEAVRTKIRSLESAAGDAIVGPCPLVRMRFICGMVETSR